MERAMDGAWAFVTVSGSGRLPSGVGNSFGAARLERAGGDVGVTGWSRRSLRVMGRCDGGWRASAPFGSSRGCATGATAVGRQTLCLPSRPSLSRLALRQSRDPRREPTARSPSQRRRRRQPLLLGSASRATSPSTDGNESALTARHAISAPTAAAPTLPHFSTEYLHLCRAQFEVLVSSVGAARCAVFFRREAPDGALEFVPICVHPELQSVWVVGNAPGSRPPVGPVALPGGLAAEWLLPDYPFVSPGKSRVSHLPDGGLSAPIAEDNMVAGLLVVWPSALPGGGGNNKGGRRRGGTLWTVRQKDEVASVARTLSLAFTLDQRRQGERTSPDDRRDPVDAIDAPPSGGAATDAEAQQRREAASRESLMISQMREVLSTILHQVRSPLSALRTFGKLLLRRLPPEDLNRDLARDIIVQSERLGDLLLPLDRVAHVPSLLPPSRGGQEAESRGTPAGGSMAASDAERHSRSRDLLLPPSTPSVGTTTAIAAGAVENNRALQPRLCWMPDVVRPLIGPAKALALELGVALYAAVEPMDTPAILADAFALREAASNIIENAIKYTALGAPPAYRAVYLWIQTVQLRPRRAASPSKTSAAVPDADQAVALYVADTGPGVAPAERSLVWQRGYRGQVVGERALPTRRTAAASSSSPPTALADRTSSSAASSARGTGLGLYVTQQLVETMGGQVVLISPWPPAAPSDSVNVAAAAAAAAATTRTTNREPSRTNGDGNAASDRSALCVHPQRRPAGGMELLVPPRRARGRPAKRVESAKGICGGGGGDGGGPGTLVGIVFRRALAA